MFLCFGAHVYVSICVIVHDYSHTVVRSVLAHIKPEKIVCFQVSNAFHLLRIRSLSVKEQHSSKLFLKVLSLGSAVHGSIKVLLICLHGIASEVTNQVGLKSASPAVVESEP